MLQIDGNHLTIDNVLKVSKEVEKVELAPSARQGMAESKAWVDKLVEKGTPVYGINTGFGIFSDKHISKEDTLTLNRNLITSHAVGTGPPLPEEAVRAAMLIRANTLASGYSGVRPAVVETLLEMLNRGVHPVIPSQGSLGSSGDLAPLAHMALVFTTDKTDSDADSGRAYYQGKEMSGAAAMQASKIKRLILGSKEGLAITNGATFSAALAALNVHAAANLMDVAEICLAMSLEALLGASAALDERLHTIRRQPGQIAVAERVRWLTQGSSLLDAAGRVQDAYSLRCAPQVQGPARDIMNFVETVVGNEINAVTDNPLLFSPEEAISGGNFHGEPIAMGMDCLKIAMAEIGAISERRIFQLTDEKMNADLPPMLVDNHEAAGLNSGMMMLQYTAASLVLENQNLAGPDSVYSLPTSGGKEDHNANAMTAARNAREVIENSTHVLALEAYCAARALDIRLRQMKGAKMGNGVAAAHAYIRERIPYKAGDAWWAPEINQAREIISNPAFAKTVLSRC